MELHKLFDGAYVGRRVLVTGHSGFKGSWLVYWLQAMGAQVSALALPSPTQPNHLSLLGLTLDSALVDVRHAEHVRDTVRHFAPEVVFHLAAQALVRESYTHPSETFDINVMGLVNVLEAVRSVDSVRAIVSVTSDKCYRNANETAGFREQDALGGHDPYSASKACAELVSASYRESFLSEATGRSRPIALATARAGNVVGGGDWSTDRLIPDLVRASQNASVVSIRRPNAVRPWQHVLEPLAGYLQLGQRLMNETDCARFAGAWNFGPTADEHLTVAEIVSGFARHMPAVRTECDDSTQPHEAELLHLNCDKARDVLRWSPVWTADRMLQRTADWYSAWYADGVVRTAEDLSTYVIDAAHAGRAWATL